MKDRYCLAGLIFVFLLVMLPVSALSAETKKAEIGKIIFCKDIGENWKPMDENSSFDVNVISWISYAKAPYGKPELSLSIYHHEGEKEYLLLRKNLEVRPSWNTTAIRNMSLPKEGKYTLSLDMLDGTPISSGTVIITKISSDTQSVGETIGTSLADIFNKYKPKQ